MLELDITDMVDDADEMPLLSGSISELGENAGKITWRNSQEYAKRHPLLTCTEQIEEAKDYFQGFGAWTRKEINSLSNEDMQAMVVQYVASRIREMEDYDSYEEFQSASEQGRVSGEIYKGDDGRWYALLS